MEKKIVIDRLDATIKMLEGLQAHEFKYSKFVHACDTKQKCGTVCCIAGWYPKFFPEAGLTWLEFDTEEWPGLVDLYAGGEGRITIDSTLIEYHNLKQHAINHLFYGEDLYIEFEGIGIVGLTNDLTNGLPEVLVVWKTFVDYMKTNDHFYNQMIWKI